ncbi:MAG: cytochrome P450 [Gammaproteobacteria bacterium]
MIDAVDFPERARTFRLTDADLQDDPFAFYARLREECPVVFNHHGAGSALLAGTPGCWVLSRYDDCRAALQDAESFSSEIWRRAPDPIALATAQLAPPVEGLVRGAIPQAIDPPLHAKYRYPLAAHFALRNVGATMEAEFRALTRRMLDRIAGGAAIDFVADFAVPLPAEYFLTLMGLPRDRMREFFGWMWGTLHANDPQTRFQSTLAILEFFRTTLAERARLPRQPRDVIGVLIEAEFGGERPFTDGERLNACFLLFLGGLDTTTTVLSNMVAFLATHPEHRDALSADPSLIPRAIEELMRYEHIVSPPRLLTRDVQMHGQTMRAGDFATLLLPAAGRDPAQFADPDAVDFDRANATQNLVFGIGPHRCLGMHLARLELRVALEELHARFPRYRLAPGARVERHNGVIRGAHRVPLALA